MGALLWERLKPLPQKRMARRASAAANARSRLNSATVPAGGAITGRKPARIGARRSNRAWPSGTAQAGPA
ncbi:hypothetical protein GCM10009090_31210 [[Pseudomonas] boreopolis]|uniref:Uncharacterized protein n=1 Tax=Xanthomonas boreopolis TaxID=86183 RepID=A0A919FA41_9XANT|nr:hypothetical protein GCM10009090_31210 [[Pseudomonas] boreopolis]